MNSFYAYRKNGKLLCRHINGSEPHEFVSGGELFRVFDLVIQDKYKMTINGSNLELKNKEYRIIIMDYENLLMLPALAPIKEVVCKADKKRDFVDKTANPKNLRVNREKSQGLPKKYDGFKLALVGAIAALIFINSGANIPAPEDAPIPFGAEVAEMSEEKQVIDDTPNVVLDLENKADMFQVEKMRRKYSELLQYVSDIYGLDPELLLGIISQFDGEKTNMKNEDGNIGLMQISYDDWVSREIEYYCFDPETGRFRRVSTTITPGKLIDDTESIHAGAIILQSFLIYYNYNLPLAIEASHIGVDETDKILAVYCEVEGKTREDVIANPNDLGWTLYRNLGGKEDAQGSNDDYLERVLACHNGTYTLKDVTKISPEVINYNYNFGDSEMSPVLSKSS